MACVDSFKKTKPASTTSPSITKTMKCLRCPRVSRRASSRVYTNLLQTMCLVRKLGFNFLAAEPFCEMHWVHKRFLRKSIKSPATFGVSPATPNFAAMRKPASVGICCTQIKPRARATSRPFWPESKGQSYLPVTTFVPWRSNCCPT